jgi:hypothetical protein
MIEELTHERSPRRVGGVVGVGASRLVIQVVPRIHDSLGFANLHQSGRKFLTRLSEGRKAREQATEPVFAENEPPRPHLLRVHIADANPTLGDNSPCPEGA